MSKKAKKATVSSRPPQIDPILIARGMSSRYLSTKTPAVAPLSRDQIAQDLRHMEAYRNACIGYNQQFFVFKNQDSVKSGTFGMFSPHPNVEGPVDITKSADGFAMPTKIDPEEEKRLSVLRKKISLTEFKREQLETEYLSLRAHYVHASQLVRKTRTYEFGRWKVFREVMERRGRVLALMRVLLAMARDVEAAIVHRGKLLQNGVNTGTNETMAGTSSASDSTPAAGDPKHDENNTRDLYDMWTEIEGKLKEAEAACAQIETPAELQQMMISDTPLSKTSQPSHNYSTRSPPKRNDDDASKTKGIKRNSNTSDESAHMSNGENGKKPKGGKKNGLGPHLIPWDSMVEPSTPFGVPILLSCLSSATDKAVGYLTDIREPKSITWLEKSLPKSTAAFNPDAEEVAKLTEEARLLEEEMKKEIMLNTELQKQIIKSRERNDQMVSMIQLLRTETEAALERHNTIMESPEARKKAAELHKLAMEAAGEREEEEQEHEENEGDIDDNGANSDEDESDDGEEEREDVDIKEITVDDKKVNVESEDESEDGEIADEDMIEGEAEAGAAEGDRKRGYNEGDEESSSLTPPKRKRRF